MLINHKGIDVESVSWDYEIKCVEKYCQTYIDLHLTQCIETL